MPESKNEPSKENGGIAHMCASHVKHATYGEGLCVEGQHTIIETSPGEGFVTHYDVDFNGKIVEDVSIDELTIIKEAGHIHSQKKHAVKKEGKMKDIDTANKEKERLKNEATGVADKAVDPHNCATHVYHEEFGDGRPVPTMHADPDEYGLIEWYDVMFEHGIEKYVLTTEMKVIKSSHHSHKKGDKK